MDDQIHDIDPATGLSRGAYVVSPDGNLVALARGASIKAGFRYATHEDVYGKSEPAPPLPVEDEVIPSDRDRD